MTYDMTQEQVNEMESWCDWACANKERTSKVWKALRLGYIQGIYRSNLKNEEVLKLLKSMTLSMAAHPDCFKRPDGAASEFYDLVEMAEKVLEGTLYTRHG